MEIEQNLDFRVIPFPKGTLHIEVEEDNAQLKNLKGVGMNLSTLPL